MRTLQSLRHHERGLVAELSNVVYEVVHGTHSHWWSVPYSLPSKLFQLFSSDYQQLPPDYESTPSSAHFQCRWPSLQWSIGFCVRKALGACWSVYSDRFKFLENFGTTIRGWWCWRSKSSRGLVCCRHRPTMIWSRPTSLKVACQELTASSWCRIRCTSPSPSRACDSCREDCLRN